MTEGRIGENTGRTQGEQDQECSASQALFHPLCPWGTLGRPSAFSPLPFSFLRCARSLPSLCTLALAMLSVGCWYPAFYYTSLITLPPTRNHGTLVHVRWGIIHLGLHPRFFLGVSASQSWFIARLWMQQLSVWCSFQEHVFSFSMLLETLVHISATLWSPLSEFPSHCVGDTPAFLYWDLAVW